MRAEPGCTQSPSPKARPSSPCLSGKDERDVAGRGDVSGAAALRPSRQTVVTESLENAFVCGVQRKSPLVSLRDQEDLNCFSMIWGCQTGPAFERDMVMRLGPKAAQFYSGYGNNHHQGSN